MDGCTGAARVCLGLTPRDHQQANFWRKAWKGTALSPTQHRPNLTNDASDIASALDTDGARLTLT
jgi:hypothetical protein